MKIDNATPSYRISLCATGVLAIVGLPSCMGTPPIIPAGIPAAPIVPIQGVRGEGCLLK